MNKRRLGQHTSNYPTKQDKVMNFNTSWFVSWNLSRSERHLNSKYHKSINKIYFFIKTIDENYKK